jgi:hypothetical protein
MQAYYGAAWLDQWIGQKQRDVQAVWADELGEFTLAEVERAARELSSPHPVRLPEFRELCKQVRARNRPSPAGPILLRDDRRVSEDRLRSIRSILTGKKGGSDGA